MPTPIRWQVPVELSPEEARLAATLHRIGKFYVFLRTVRAALFDEAFQAELAAAYHPRGTTPLPAALLAMVTVLQAYDQVGDAEAVVAARVDQRWQLVLGCLGERQAPFSQGALVKFRERMIAHDLDRKLLDRTVALAKQTGRFGWQALRAALDSSPLVGAGRVEDTWNLLGRALGAVVTCAAATLKIPRAQVLHGAGVTLLGAPSLKAALDIDWGDPAAQADALARLLIEVDRVEAWVAAHVSVAEAPPVQAAVISVGATTVHFPAAVCRPASSARPVRPRHAAGARSRSIPRKPSSNPCGPRHASQTAARTCGNGPPSSTRSPASTASKGAKPATKARARTRSTCAAPPWWPTCNGSLGSRRPRDIYVFSSLETQKHSAKRNSAPHK